MKSESNYGNQKAFSPILLKKIKEFDQPYFFFRWPSNLARPVLSLNRQIGVLNLWKPKSCFSFCLECGLNDKASYSMVPSTEIVFHFVRLTLMRFPFICQQLISHPCWQNISMVCYGCVMNNYCVSERARNSTLIHCHVDIVVILFVLVQV